MSFISQEVAALFVPPTELPSSGASPTRYESMDSWGGRRWEGADTTRLNSAHWTYARDESINAWLSLQLPTLRARGGYEAKNNGIILGMIATHADDIVGPDGPTLQVQSEDAGYNEALEWVWKQWFYAPTHRRNISGAALLKLWIKDLWKGGAFLAQMITDDQAEGPVKMRLRPIHTRRLGNPADQAGNDRVFMGIEYDRVGRPIRYYVADQTGIGTGLSTMTYSPIPADLIVHEYLWEEEDQGAGVPWMAPGLQPAADLRDFDDQIQDAARQMADQSAILWTQHPDAPVWTNPETTTIQRRTIKMAPPGWQPAVYPATQPPVQYPDYRAERQLELGRPASMPRLLVRMDASKHSWASARLDMTTYRRACRCLQAWLGGSERSTGTLNRLVDEVAREARFSDPALRRRPKNVSYHWTWPQVADVEPEKTATANETSLRNSTETLIDILAARNETLDGHIEKLRRVLQAFKDAGLPPPAWLQPSQQNDSQQVAAPAPNSDQQEAIEEVLSE